MKKVCWILLIGIFSILPNNLFAQFEFPGPSLSDTGACSLDHGGGILDHIGKKVTGWGHSRVYQAHSEIAGALIDPNDPTKGTILAPGQLNAGELSLNIIGGSTVTDNPGPTILQPADLVGSGSLLSNYNRVHSPHRNFCGNLLLFRCGKVRQSTDKGMGRYCKQKLESSNRPLPGNSRTISERLESVFLHGCGRSGVLL